MNYQKAKKVPRITWGCVQNLRDYLEEILTGWKCNSLSICENPICDWLKSINLFLKDSSIHFRERKSRGKGRGRGRKRKNPQTDPCWVQSQSRAQSQDPEFMTWTKGRHLTNWATQLPSTLFLFKWSLRQFDREWIRARESNWALVKRLFWCTGRTDSSMD